MLKAVLMAGASTGAVVALSSNQWADAAVGVGQYVLDAYFIAFVDAVSFGTLCF